MLWTLYYILYYTLLYHIIPYQTIIYYVPGKLSNAFRRTVRDEEATGSLERAVHKSRGLKHAERWRGFVRDVWQRRVDSQRVGKMAFLTPALLFEYLCTVAEAFGCVFLGSR